MSGRTRHLRDGKWITNRKTDRRQSPRAAPHEMPAFRLTFMLPASIAFSVAEGATGVFGVTVRPGHIVEACGKDRDWVFKQAAEFLGLVAEGQELSLPATLYRSDTPAPTLSGAATPGYIASVEVIAVPGPSVIYPRYLDRALIFPVKR